MRIGRHPARRKLMLHAESLVDGQTPVSAQTAKHVAQCHGCRREVDSMRSSLDFIAGVPELEPTDEQAAAILLRASAERMARDERNKRNTTIAGLVKIVACAACIIAVATVYFNVVMGGHEQRPVSFAAPVQESKTVTQNSMSPEAIRQTTAEVQALAAAVRGGARNPRNLWERQHLRTVRVLDDDIAAAQAALERNPGCTRANEVVTANLQRQAQALRKLYVERDL